MGSEITDNRYTDQQYWEKYYKAKRINTERITKVVGLYDVYWEKLIHACKKKPETIIEIGAYPGRYLAYLASKYKLQPTSLDFNSDVNAIKSVFKSFNIDNFDCIQADFLEHQTNLKYDLVISVGFIEHFENFDEVMDKHCKYLSETGAMLIMIPNMRYVKKWYAQLLDSQNLKIHNLKSMKLKNFKDFADRNNLELKTLTYFGGFPFNVHQNLNFWQRMLFKTSRSVFKILNPLIEKYPNRYLSSSIISIYTRR